MTFTTKFVPFKIYEYKTFRLFEVSEYAIRYRFR